MTDECLKTIPISLLDPTVNPLRQVNERLVEFDELRDSVEECGILQPLLARPVGKRFQVVDGMHRYTVARALGLASVPCIVRSMTDYEAMCAQLECNAHRLETTPVDYARRLRAILRRFPEMTEVDLARLIHKSAAWVKSTLGLLKLVPEAAKAAERGEIPLKSAYLIARLGPTQQREFLPDALSRTATEFDVLYRTIVNQTKGDSHVNPEPFNPVPHMRSLKLILRELESPEQAAVLLAAEGVDNLLDAFLTALRWVTHTDILSIRKYEHEYRTRHDSRKLLTTPVDLDGDRRV